jgi:MFS family permease
MERLCGFRNKQMSNTAEQPPAEPSAAKPSGFTTGQLVQAIRDNFVLISGMALVFGVTMATTFLAAYLSVFDWHLLWFVQYTDIITFGLLALGIISLFLMIIQAFAQLIINFFKLDKRNRKRGAWALGFLALLFLGSHVWSAVYEHRGYFHVLWATLALALGVIVIVQVSGYVMTGTIPTVVQFTFLMILVISGAGALGQWLGYSVLEAGEIHDIKTKRGTLDGQKLVIVMSRHTVLMKDRDISVLPTADILQFHTTAPLY